MVEDDARRVAFEKFVRKHTEFDLERREDGDYAFGGASDMYMGWLAGVDFGWSSGFHAGLAESSAGNPEMSLEEKIK